MARTRGTLSTALALLVLAVLPAGSVASAAPSEAHVDVREEYYYPSLLEVRRGGSVVWDFTGQATHDVVDGTGLQLFDSGLRPPGGPSFAFSFVAAGSYPYLCSLHAGMVGRVEVPIRARVRADGIAAVWASEPLPDGLVADVQVRRGRHRWRAWLEGTTELRGTYGAARGSFRVRARLRSSAEGGAASGWSAAARVEVG